jgi:hypothetical protein
MCCALLIRNLAVGNTCFVTVPVDHMLAMPRQHEDDNAEEKTFLDALREWQAARKYICMFDAEGNITVKLKMNYTD